MPIESNDAWKQRFRASRIFNTQIAKASPSRGLVVSNQSGIAQLYAWSLKDGELRLLTNEPKGVAEGVISPDGRYVCYLDDDNGNEIGHYLRVPFEGGEGQNITPDIPPYSSAYISVSRSVNMMGFTITNSEGFHTYIVELGEDGSLGRRHQLYQSQRLCNGPFFSYSGELAAIASTERLGGQHYSLLIFDPLSGEKIAELWDAPDSNIEPFGFSSVQGDLRLLATTTRSGVRRPLLWNPTTGKRTDFLLQEMRGDVVPLDWSSDAGTLLISNIDRAIQKLYLLNLVENTLKPLNHPSGTFNSAYFGANDQILAEWENSTTPLRVITLNSGTGEQQNPVLTSEDVVIGRPWKSVTFASSDNQDIQGWIAVPDGKGPFPTILEMHGGPEFAVTNSFDPGSQAWTDFGFAFMTINYRGSTTFGREFQEKISGNLGHWELEDMVAARNWLIESGIATPDKIFLAGFSYGGYMTLYALGKQPDLWAGGMAGIATTDWIQQFEDETHLLKAYDIALFGGSPIERHQEYIRSSPVTYIENVKAPVLIIQGRNDTRCPPRQIEAYESKMKALGKNIHVEWFDGGHGSLDIEQSIAHQEIMLRFVLDILSGDANKTST